MNSRNFPKIKGRVRFDEPLLKHTTFHIGGPASVWVQPRDENELKEILRFAKLKKKKIFIVGKGSNVLFKDRGFNGIVINLSAPYFQKIKFTGTKVTAGAGIALSRLIDMSCKKGLEGLTGLVGIPGTLGGAISMNASYKGSISDCLEGIKVMDKSGGSAGFIKAKKIKFGYRHSNLDKYIILKATFRLRKDDRTMLAKRKNKLLVLKKNEQPLSEYSAGCIFRNPAKHIFVARYIDMLGLKGKRIGGAEISKKHANFIVNSNNATSRDVINLINFVKGQVKSRLNIKLDAEIIIV